MLVRFGHLGCHFVFVLVFPRSSRLSILFYSTTVLWVCKDRFLRVHYEYGKLKVVGYLFTVGSPYVWSVLNDVIPILDPFLFCSSLWPLSCCG